MYVKVSVEEKDYVRSLGLICMLQVSVEEDDYVRSLGLICMLQVSVEENIMFDHLVLYVC